MLIRLKWLAMELDTARMRALVDGMRKQEYQDGESSGFQLWEIRRDSTEGTYIERVHVRDHVVDPFGRDLPFERIEFRSVKFELRTRMPTVQILNPTQTVRPLVTRMAEILSFAVPLVPIEVNVLSWLREVERRLGRLVVRRIKVTGVPVGGESVGTVQIEGPLDVRRDLRSFLERRAFTIENVVAHGDSFAINLSRAAVAGLSAEAPHSLAGDLRESLSMCMGSS